MKLTKVSTIAALALGGLVAMSTMVSAQDAATPGKGKGKGRMPTVEQQMEALTTELTLTDAQKPKVKAVLEETTKKRQDLRADTSLDQAGRREKMTAIVDDQDKKLKEILDAGQMEKYKKYQAEMRKKGKGGGGGGGGGGGTPPAKTN